MTSISRRFLLGSLLLAMLLGSGVVLAHGGEDHGDEGHPPAPAVSVAPRASARSDEFELVAVLELGPTGAGQLSLILDRFASNEPVVGAKVEIETGGQSVLATEASPGVYVAALGALASAIPGTKLPLTLSIEAGEIADLLTTQLEIPASAVEGVAHVHGWAEILVWLVSLLLGLVAITLLVVRRHRQLRGAQA